MLHVLCYSLSPPVHVLFIRTGQILFFWCQMPCTVPSQNSVGKQIFLMCNRGSVWPWVPLQIEIDLSEKSCFKSRLPGGKVLPLLRICLVWLQWFPSVPTWLRAMYSGGINLPLCRQKNWDTESLNDVPEVTPAISRGTGILWIKIDYRSGASH